MKNNVVIVYGSGASYASGYRVDIKLNVDDICRPTILNPPMDQNFFKEIPEEYISIKYHALSHFIGTFYPQGMNCSLEKVWTDVDINHKHISLDTYNWKSEGEEYLLKFHDNYRSMDLSYEYFDGKFFSTSPRYNKYKYLGDCGRDFRMLVYDIYSNYIDPGDDDHFKLLHKSLDSSRYDNIAYVTFNYDCYLEQSLADKRIKYITLNDNTDCFDSLMHDSIPIVKLHGSLSWAESRQSAIYKIEYQTFPYSKKSQVEPRYKGENDWLQPAIIPPTMIKQEINDESRLENDLTKTILQQWRAAITLLAEADLIIIVGYSFPIADHHVDRIFRISNIIKKRNGGNPPSVLYCCGSKNNEKRKTIENLYGEDAQIDTTTNFERLVESREFQDILK